MMSNLGLNPSQEELEDMISEVDKDRNGQIEFMEFLVMMARLVESSSSQRAIHVSHARYIIDKPRIPT